MPRNENPHVFPENFLWGASTAGHQVEGGNYDQWTVWELENAVELARTAEKRLGSLPAWPDIKPLATDPENYISGKGVMHYQNFRSDFDIVKKIGLNAFRFSIEWSRLEPEIGNWDEKEINHYHNYIAELKKRGIEPVVNLWHWTHPVWFEERGGFGPKDNLSFWMRFVQKVADEYGGDITFVIPLNEPNIYVSYSDLNNVAVPPQGSKFTRLLMYRNLARAHRLAYRILKKANPDIRVGTAHQISNDQAKDSFVSKLAAKAVSYAGSWWFLDRIKRSVDFIGFNYYFTNHFDGLKPANPESPKNDLGFYMEPSGISEVIMKLWIRYHKPIMVTENGVADASDAFRQWWLEETMAALVKARKAGADVIGYMHWSLLDNFEWAFGWWPKFGLIKVDRKNGMKRIVRPSAVWWSEELKKLKQL